MLCSGIPLFWGHHNKVVSEGGRLGLRVESSLPRVLGKTLVKFVLYIVGLLITWGYKVKVSQGQVDLLRPHPPRLWNIFALNSSSRENKRSKQKEVNQSFIGRRSWEQDIPTDNTELNIWHHIQLDRIAILSHEGPSVVFNIDALLRHWLDLPPRPLRFSLQPPLSRRSSAVLALSG